MTTNHELLERICREIPDFTFRKNEPIAPHTSFRIGGNAAVMAFPNSIAQLADLLRLTHENGITPRLLGAGTNVLVPDEGLDELLICTKDALCGLRLDGTTVYAAAGESLASAAVFARENALTGLEFAHGIPGTVGGGVYMNAGAYEEEICGVCQAVTVVMPDGTIKRYEQSDMFSYRTSIFQSMPCVIAEAEFTLKTGDKEKIRAKMHELMERRRASQPLELPSAGSTFKRPKGAFAGALIEASGLKGFSIGGAQVSPKHAGFVVNTGGATAADVRNLMQAVQKKVYEDSGFCLEPEIRIW